MAAGLSVLAGGQVWAFTGSTSLAVASGSLVMAALAWCYWRYFRNRRGVRFIGEVHQQVDESEFTVLAPGQFDAQERVRAKVGNRAQQAAGTVRAMLRDDVGKQRGAKKEK